MQHHTELNRHRFITPFSIAAILCAVYFIYSFGFGGIFFFDDPAAFEGLTSVKDWNSALLYISSGEAGPLGRPVALATFLLHASSYPENPQPFFLMNTLVHLCNIVLIATITRQLQISYGHLLPQNPWFPACVAATWGALPILLSTSMMAVQRMTSLSAFFVFLGISIYLWGKQREHSLASTALSVAGVAICTILAALCKENGLLLPLLLGVLNFTLTIEKQSITTSAARLRHFSIAAPSIAIIGYIAYRSLTIAETYDSRPFDLSERLATQTVILWEYLLAAFVPSVMSLSPFRDDHTIYQFHDLPVILASLGWATIIGVAAFLRKRKPLLFFAILWYLAGHSIESTIFPLHLYFEHRNYVPIVGPVIAVVASAFMLPGKLISKLFAGSCYIVFLLFVLWQAASIWGNRQQLLWAYEHPGSPRAVQTIAGAYLQAGQIAKAAELYRRTHDHFPKMTSATLQGLRLSCYQESDVDAVRWLAVSLETLGESNFSALSLQALQAIVQLRARDMCSHVQSKDLHMILDVLSNNPAFQSPASQSIIHRTRGMLYSHEKHVDLAIEEFERALHYRLDLGTVVDLFLLLREHRGLKSAQLFLAELRAELKFLNPWKKAHWHEVIDGLMH